MDTANSSMQVLITDVERESRHYDLYEYVVVI
jgi:hypothetical protein